MSKSHGRKSRRHHLKRRAPPGAPPGTLIADPEAAPSHLRVMSYGPDELREKEGDAPSSLPASLENWPVTWVNVTGLGDLKTVQQIGESFGLHMLALEDVVNVHQRSKVEHYGAYDFITVQIVDLIETYREMASGMMDVYLSSVSNRMNEVMKVLTIIATIFIPLSFIASIYGMNFSTEASRWNMPELRWRYGYPFAIGVMALMAGGMLLFFWRKGWLGGRGGASPPDSGPMDGM